MIQHASHRRNQVQRHLVPECDSNTLRLLYLVDFEERKDDGFSGEKLN